MGLRCVRRDSRRGRKMRMMNACKALPRRSNSSPLSGEVAGIHLDDPACGGEWALVSSLLALVNGSTADLGVTRKTGSFGL